MLMVKKTIATPKHNEFTASPLLPFYQSGCALLYNHMRSLRKVAPHGQLRIALRISLFFLKQLQSIRTM